MEKKTPARGTIRFKDMVLDEGTWRRFERMVASRERPRLIRKGYIVPAALAGPTPLVKSGDNWIIPLVRQ